MTDINLKTASSIHEIDMVAWNQLSQGLPFQSHRWYAFGERVMTDCPPTYLLIYKNNELISRAAFWLIRNEPLPDLSPALRTIVMFLLKRWPLFICRSPLANVSGVVLPNGPEHADTLSMLAQAAITEADKKGASFAVFDYLREEEIHRWPSTFSLAQVSNPGTVMQNRWENLDDFLMDGNKKDRQHYKRTLREVEKLGICLDKYQKVPEIEDALALIHQVDLRHGNAPNPWTRNLLIHMDEMDGTWLEAHVDKRLVGCGLLLEDNAAQTTTALGLVDDVPYAYFLLVYASLETAFQKKMHLLRWGSGAYEAKQRLGFTKTNDNYVMVAGINLIARTLVQFFT